MQNPGCLNHSRWQTTANRILRLYTSDKNSSKKPQVLNMFIIRVYTPRWFAIKSNSSCKDKTLSPSGGQGHWQKFPRSHSKREFF